ncbi:hypothetical protein ACP70R_024308 [Stipagrostis hirtigluma subsp. patula]
MRRPAGSVRRAAAAALAILFGFLVLMSLVMDHGKPPVAPASDGAIGGRKMMAGANGVQRTLEDFKADDPFQDSKRRVPNGPDPIHNRWELASLEDRRAGLDGAHAEARKLPKRQRVWSKQVVHCKKEEEEQTREAHCGGSGWMWV